MSNWADFLPLLFLVIIFWLLIIRPARARQRAFAKTQSELSVGDRVVLASGMFGEVAAIADETLELRIAPETVVTVYRQAVGQIIRNDAPATDS